MAQNGSYELINHLIAGVEKIDYEPVLLEAEEKYGVKEFKVSQISPSNAFEIYSSVYTKAKKNHIPNSELNWWENELRIFIWILVSYLKLRGMAMDELGFSDWEFFSRLFPNKQEILFEYQALSLQRENTNTKKWSNEEDELFTALVLDKGGKYKWSELAKELYIQSQRRFFRSPKQCRERWLNHLDPNKSKQEWQAREDYVLVTHVRSKGKKWAQISKLLKNRRNEHSIKNRFKSLLTKEEKLHPQGVDQQTLLENLHRKYQNHFAKIRQANPMISISAQTLPEQQQRGMNFEEADFFTGKRAFQISNPIRVKQPISTRSIEPHINELSGGDQEERQKQIRAEMFLSNDPFTFLKRFFKSKDELEW